MLHFYFWLFKFSWNPNDLDVISQNGNRAQGYDIPRTPASRSRFLINPTQCLLTVLFFVQHGLIFFSFSLKYSNWLRIVFSAIVLLVNVHHGVGCRSTEKHPQGVDALAPFGPGIVPRFDSPEWHTNIARSPSPLFYHYSPPSSPSTATKMTPRPPF